MRRGSFVAPLLLILIGGLFLVNNLRPELPVLSIIARYWPYLLIAWGGLRLIEVVFSYSQNPQTPVRGMGGGEWLLVLLVCFIGAGVMGFNHWSPRWPGANMRIRGLDMFGEAFDYPSNAGLTTDGVTRIVVDNLRGNARIVGADVKEVKVVTRQTVRALGKADADKLHEQAPLQVSTQGGILTIRTSQERAGSEGRISDDLEITVPKNIALECKGRYGDFEVHDVNAPVEIKSDNAGVRLQNIGAAVKIDLGRSDIVRAVDIRGDVDIRGRGGDLELESITGLVTVAASFSGDIQFRNIAKPMRFESSISDITVEKIIGQLRMTRGELTASDIVGPIRVKSRNKDVEITRFSNSIEIDVDRGDVTLFPDKLPLGKMDVRTNNGDVELALPENAKFDLTAETDHGEVTNDFGPGLKSESKHRGGTISGKLGGPEIKVSINRGALSVRKGNYSESISPASPLAPGVPVPPKAPPPKAPKLEVTQQ